METVFMKTTFLIANVVSILLVLFAVQSHGFFPFDSESEFTRDSEASKFSLENQHLPWKIPSNSDETSLLSESEVPQDSEASKLPLETQHFPWKTESNPEETSLLSETEFPLDFEDRKFAVETHPFPSKTSQSSESGFVLDFEGHNEPFETQQVPREIDSNHEIKSPPQSPAPSPSETPSPAKAPYPPKHPWNPENTSKSKCSTKYTKNKVPILRNLCNKVCTKRCLLHHLELIYNCTNHCAESMPKNLKSDKKKAAGYVKYCYKKCI